MFVRWNDVLEVPNDISTQDEPQEHLELYAVSDGRLLTVKKVQSSGKMVRVWLDV